MSVTAATLYKKKNDKRKEVQAAQLRTRIYKQCQTRPQLSGKTRLNSTVISCLLI